MPIIILAFKLTYIFFSCVAVVKGEIKNVINLQTVPESQVHITADKIHRQSHQVFKRSVLNIPDRKDSDSNHFSEKSNDKNTGLLYTGHVIVPEKCKTGEGDGIFLFMGRIRLKRAHLVCAPRYEVFERLWKEAKRLGVNNCEVG